MMQRPILGCDAHKRYSVFVRLREDGKADPPTRVNQDNNQLRAYLASLAESSDIAIESTGHWYWLVDEIEQAGHRAHLTQPFTAKRMMGHTHKTDPLDAKGLAILLRTGTLPEVWIPPRDLRDLREILRCLASITFSGRRQLFFPINDNYSEGSPLELPNSRRHDRCSSLRCEPGVTFAVGTGFAALLQEPLAGLLQSPPPVDRQ